LPATREARLGDAQHRLEGKPRVVPLRRREQPAAAPLLARPAAPASATAPASVAVTAVSEGLRNGRYVSPRDTVRYVTKQPSAFGVHVAHADPGPDPTSRAISPRSSGAAQRLVASHQELGVIAHTSSHHLEEFSHGGTENEPA
jgi:hypothetical protein